MFRIRRATALLLALLMAFAAMGVTSSSADAQQETQSFFFLYGIPGEYISQGEDVFHTEVGETVFSPSVNFDNGISVLINVYEDGTFIEQWHTNFAAPDEAPLAAGDSFTATRFPFQAPGTAGLSVFGDGRGCNTSTGEFTVLELEVSESGTVENFAADFTQACGIGAEISGGVRINSTLPNPDPEVPGGDTTAPVAFAGLDQTGRIKGTSSNFFVEASCSDNEPGVALASAEINGIAVNDGQKVRLVISNREKVTNRKGKLTIQSSAIELTVTCVDVAGNTATASVQPAYVAD